MFVAMNEKSHGGKRTGAGRKPKDPSGKKEQGSWTLAPDVLKIIQSQANQAEFIESAVRLKHRLDNPE